MSAPENRITNRTWLPLSLVLLLVGGVWTVAAQWGGVRTELRDLNSGMQRMEKRLDNSVEMKDFDRWTIQFADWNPDARVPYSADVRDGRPVREIKAIRNREYGKQ